MCWRRGLFPLYSDGCQISVGQQRPLMSRTTPRRYTPESHEHHTNLFDYMSKKKKKDIYIIVVWMVKPSTSDILERCGLKPIFRKTEGSRCLNTGQGRGAGGLVEVLQTHRSPSTVSLSWLGNFWVILGVTSRPPSSWSRSLLFRVEGGLWGGGGGGEGGSLGAS